MLLIVLCFYWATEVSVTGQVYFQLILIFIINLGHFLTFRLKFQICGLILLINELH